MSGYRLPATGPTFPGGWRSSDEGPPEDPEDGPLVDNKPPVQGRWWPSHDEEKK